MAANVMAANTTTLRQALTQNKPFVPCYMAPGRNTVAPPQKLGNETWPTPAVTIWNEFNLTNLNESYGHILDSPTLEARLPYDCADQVLSGISIRRDKHVKHLIGWNNFLMQPALQLAKSQLNLYPGLVLCHRHSTVDGSQTAKLLDKHHTFSVHHVIGLYDFPAQHFVVGFGRSSSRWDDAVLAAQPDTTTMELLLPIRQLANICREAETRYGYVQTDKELVVCCFSRDHNDQWKAAIMPIPWTRGGPNNLTSDLALWWLCMLAMSDSCGRAIVAEDDMDKIDGWDIFYDNERGWGRRHCYSNFEKPTDPPSPANHGAVDVAEAGLGQHGMPNQWFDLGNPADVDHIGADQMEVDHALPRDHVLAGSANEWFNMELDVNLNANVNFEIMADLTHHVRPVDDPLSGPAASE